MQKHTVIYMKYFGHGEQEFIPCENCGKRASDVHHLKFRSQGGMDEIENLMGLCRKDHERAHNDPEYNEQLKQIHLRFIKDFKP